MADDDMKALIKRVGITDDEVRMHPEHGLMINMSAVRKISAAVPDTAKKMEFLAALTEWVNNGCR
jgi:hypothetical protein